MRVSCLTSGVHHASAESARDSEVQRDLQVLAYIRAQALVRREVENGRGHDRIDAWRRLLPKVEETVGLVRFRCVQQRSRMQVGWLNVSPG